MRFLLTSGGITNPTILEALEGLLGKPLSEATALCIPTAQWGHPHCGPSSVRGFVAGKHPWGNTTGLGWRSLGVLELTALPSIEPNRWLPWIEQADVLVADGGDATYLCHWMQQSGLAALMPRLQSKVWVGISAGSMVMTPRVGQEFVGWSPTRDDTTLGLVNLSIFPHLGAFPENTMSAAYAWAVGVDSPAYAIDDQTAIKVVDGVIEVVTEGTWQELSQP